MLIDTIKKDRMVARKEGNKIKYNILTLLVGQMDQSSDKSDAVVIAKINSLLKGVLDRVFSKYSEEDQAVAGEERDVLNSYLPEKISAVKIKALIEGCSSIGEAMKVVKGYCSESGLLFNGNLVSEIYKAIT